MRQNGIAVSDIFAGVCLERVEQRHPKGFEVGKVSSKYIRLTLQEHGRACALGLDWEQQGQLAPGR